MAGQLLVGVQYSILKFSVCDDAINIDVTFCSFSYKCAVRRVFS